MTINITGDPSQDRAFQYVPVPNEHVPAVYQLLSQLAMGVTPTAGAAVSQSGWTDEALRRFAAGDTETTVIVSKVMDALGDRPDEWLDLDELAELTGRDRNQLRRVWTHLSRHMRAQYDSAEWPLTMKWGTDFTPRRGPLAFYSLTAAEAEQWKRVRTS